MKIILDYWGYWETFEIKWATQTQMIEIRKKVIFSFTHKKIDLSKIQERIEKATSVNELFH